MSRRKIEPENEPSKIRKPFPKREDASILNTCLNDEHVSLETPQLQPSATIEHNRILPDHNLMTVSLSAREWNQNGADLSIQEELKMCGDVGASTSNSNNIVYAEEQQEISNKKSRYDGERTVDRSVVIQMHITDLPPELLIEIFDFLLMEDLDTIRQTSKRWRQLAGYCFERSYSPILVHVGSYKHEHCAAFSQLIRRISIFQEKRDLLQKIIAANSIFHHLRIVRLKFIDLTGLRIDSGNAFFSNIEHLDIMCCKMDKNFADCILTLSANLKRLALCQDTLIGNEWFDRKYPKLEGCAFIRCDSYTPIQNVPIAMLVNHPNIRELGANCDALLRQAQSMRTASLKLDILHVHLTDVTDEMESSVIRVLLNELYELKVFKRLHLYIDNPDKFMTDNDLALLLGLRKLYMHYGNVSGEWPNLSEIEPFQLKPLKSLDELSVFVTLHIKDIEAAAASLQNLERFHANFANFSHIVLLIKQSMRLKEIAVWSFDTVGYYENYRESDYVDYFEFEKNSEKSPNVIDLCMLNSERAKLPNAQKVTLYVEEPLYLATKLAVKGTVNLEFTRLKRIQSFQQYYGLFLGSVAQSTFD